MTASTPLGIIAGAGSMPITIADAARSQGRDVFIVALEGWADPGIESFPHKHMRMSKVMDIMAELRQRGCVELVMVGGISRPKRWRRDVGLRFIWSILTNIDLMWSGDSTALSKVVRFLERNGFVVRGAHEIAPDLVLPPGPLGRRAPNSRDQKDIAKGFESALTLGALDIGQGVVVARNRVLAVEAAEGTDAMLERVKALNKVDPGSRQGVLVKCPQPIQDLRVDMPTIGPETVRRAAEARLAGIAVAAGSVLVIEAKQVEEIANASDMFVMAHDSTEFEKPRPSGPPS